MEAWRLCFGTSFRTSEGLKPSKPPWRLQPGWRTRSVTLDACKKDAVDPIRVAGIRERDGLCRRGGVADWLGKGV
jgi:hypothetical protein